MKKLRLMAMNSSVEWGGNELWLSKTLNGLSRRGHDVVLAARTNIFSGRIDEGIKVQKLPFRH
ncbi:MAG: hypothetical protein ACOC2K_04605, partial [Bacteroidota bacterium]